MTWRGIEGDQQIYWATLDGSGWSHQKPISGRATNHTPAITYYQKKLYMAWKGVEVGKTDDQGIYWATLDGSSWSHQEPIPGIGSASKPALITFQGNLYMAWRGVKVGKKDDQGICWTTFDGSTWSSQQRIPDVGSASEPSLATFQGKLYMAWRGIDKDQQIYWATFDGSTWSHQHRIPGRAAPHSPAIAVLETTEQKHISGNLPR